MKEVTDPNILMQLGQQEVTDPNILSMLNGQEPVEEPQEEGFFSRLGDDLGERGVQLANLVAGTYDQTPQESMLQFGGAVTGGVMDVLGAVAKETIIDPAIALTPDFIKEGVSDTAKAFLDTPLGMAGMEAATQGIEAYGAWAKENPRAARNLASVGNVGVLMTPVKKGIPTPMKETVIGKKGDKIIAGVAEDADVKRKGFIEELLLPKQTKKVTEDQATRTTETGILKTSELIPTESNTNMVNEISKLDVKPSNSTQANLNVIQAANKAEAVNLDKLLGDSKIAIPPAEYKKVLRKVQVKLADESLLVGDARKVAGLIAAEMNHIIEKHPSSPKGLLDARKELDKWVIAQKGEKIFDANENATTVALREIRQATNEFINDKTPSVDVADSLQKQSKYYDAIDILKPKVEKLGSNRLTRAWDKISKALPIDRMDNRQLGTLGILGGGGALAGLPIDTILATAIGGITLVKGVRMATPAAKKAMGDMLKLTDEAIRVTHDKALLKELRTSRSVLLELYEDTQVTEPEEEVVEPTKEQPTDDQISMLRDNTDLAPEFDEAFGDGAADAIINPPKEVVKEISAQQLAVDDAQDSIKRFDKLPPIKQAAVVGLSYQLGGLDKVKGVKAAIKDGNFRLAARELVLDDWFDQTAEKRELIQQLIG